MFDVLIIGGGITGAGAARDAAMRGLSTCLVEADDLAFGTSSRSSKLVHGGLRYLEQGELGLVFESVSERRVLMDIAPHLVNPLGFLFPVYKGKGRSVFTLDVGMWLYDGLSLFRSPRLHRTLKPRQVEAEEPGLRREGLTGAPLYYDCATDDARLTLENALDARARGATIRTHTRVTGFLSPGGRVRGVRVRDMLRGTEEALEARVVVNATGPWTDLTRSLLGPGPTRLRPTRGVHVVVGAERLAPRHALICAHPQDERKLFVIPWGERTYVGTTDTDDPGDPAQVHASSQDVDYLLAAANHYFPEARLVREDVLSTWAGLRPLLAAEGSESSLSREHAILLDPSGLLSIAGGKLTTYRKMAAQVVDQVVALLRLSGAAMDTGEAPTGRVPLPGAEGWPADDDHEAVARRVVEASGGTADLVTGRLFAGTYGMRALSVAARMAQDPSAAEPIVPGRPERMAQVDVAMEEELALRLNDVLVRRTQIFFRDRDQGLSAAPRVAARMAEKLGWEEERLQAELDRYRAEVELSRRWKES
jgi:glycerol-3-phosphate dehydrogenase